MNGIISYLKRPFSSYFLLGLVVVNAVALLPFNPLYIGSLLSFFYILVTPGYLFLPLITRKKLPLALGLAFSVALSIFSLMGIGLALNTLLPMINISGPLTTGPLLIAFDVFIYILLILNYEFKENSPFEFHTFNLHSWIILGLALSLPIFAALGAISLNDGGSDFFTMLCFAIIALLLPLLLIAKRLNPSVMPLTLFMMALSLLLMNSLRGWYITGHDILLEYHVFTLTNNAHLWNMAFYRDPYMACLSLTILPTYLDSLIHVDPAYIFKFFTQFIGALPVIVIYYLAKECVSERIALLVAFLYITFPTFMIDMAFLNRQGIAFLFFSSMIYIMLTTEYVSGWKRMLLLFIFGISMILSHYSTSYIAVPMLLVAYFLTRIMRLIVNLGWPRWFANLTDRLGNKDMYRKPILISLPFVLCLFVIMVLWSAVITKTSKNAENTIQQIITTIEHPFGLDEYSGPAKYSLVQSQTTDPTTLLNTFVQNGVQAQTDKRASDYFPQSVIDKYPVTPTTEELIPITPLGALLQRIPHLDLTAFFAWVKQFYARATQILIFIGFVGICLGYSFKKKLIRNVPIEYIAISIAGIVIMVSQTILPAGAIDYGLLRLFQQNLMLLGLPIILGFFLLVSLVIKDVRVQTGLCAATLIAFFLILSGFLPQLLGGARPPLSLDNYGLYYDSYYMHAQEVYAMQWTTENLDPTIRIQAAHFSDIKMVAYGQIQPQIELLPQTTRRDGYVYLNYFNDTQSTIIETVNSDILYYRYPKQFLDDNKALIYNNGGSEIYR